MTPTPKEKAHELYFFYEKILLSITRFSIHHEIKKCVLKNVEDLIKYTASINSMPPNCQSINEYCREYWQEVKQEIEKL